jgi:hypothetical protein
MMVICTKSFLGLFSFSGACKNTNRKALLLHFSALVGGRRARVLHVKQLIWERARQDYFALLLYWWIIKSLIKAAQRGNNLKSWFRREAEKTTPSPARFLKTLRQHPQKVQIKRFSTNFVRFIYIKNCS